MAGRGTTPAPPPASVPTAQTTPCKLSSGFLNANGRAWSLSRAGPGLTAFPGACAKSEGSGAQHPRSPPHRTIFPSANSGKGRGDTKMSADSFLTPPPPVLEERAGSSSPRASSLFVSPVAEHAAAVGDSLVAARAASSSSAASSVAPRPAPGPGPARSASTALPPHVAAGAEVAAMGGVAGGVSRKTVRRVFVAECAVSSRPSSLSSSTPPSHRPSSLPPHPPILQQVFDRPECLITWAADFPDRLRLVKRLTLFPLRLALRADYHRPTRSFSYGCAATDAVWGGSVLLDAGSRSVHYHKAVPVGGGACVGIHAAASYGGLLAGRGFSAESLRPSLSFQYELGGGAAVWTGGRIDGRHRFRVAKGLGLEVLGFAQLPAPRARYTAGSDLALPGGGRGGNGNGGRGGTPRPRPGVITLGEGPLHLHFEEVNVVLEL
jgi:hypothetical protein